MHRICHEAISYQPSVSCFSVIFRHNFSRGGRGTKNTTYGPHRARRRCGKIFEIFCAEWCIFSRIRKRKSLFVASWTTCAILFPVVSSYLTTFHPKLCRTCLKSGGGVLYPHSKKWGYAYPLYPTFYAYEFFPYISRAV